MNDIHQRLIDENPNVNSTVLSKLIGEPVRKIERHRETAVWRYKGKGIPFLSFCNTSESAFYCVTYRRKLLFKGKLEGALEQVDRVIFCLENNNGKIPSFKVEPIMSNMEFIR